MGGVAGGSSINDFTVSWIHPSGRFEWWSWDGGGQDAGGRGGWQGWMGGVGYLLTISLFPGFILPVEVG